MTPQQELDALLASMAAQGVKIVRKDQSKFWRFLAWVVMVVTFGGNKTFGTDFTTTIYKTIAVTPDWDSFSAEDKLQTLTHEMVHVGQFHKYTPFVMGFLYLFIFLPFGLAYFRYRFEREAYLVEFKRGIAKNLAKKDDLIEMGVAELSGPDYGWAWPFKSSIRKWFQKNLA